MYSFSLTVIATILLIRYTLYFESVRFAIKDRYSNDLTLNGHNFINACTDGLLYYLGFYKSIIEISLGYFYIANGWNDLLLASSAYLIHYFTLRQIKIRRNIWDFAATGLSRNQASVDKFFANFPMDNFDPSILLFNAMVENKQPFIKAIIKLKPEAINSSRIYCNLGLFFGLFTTKSENILEAYILGSKHNNYYCRPEIVDLIIEAGTIVSPKTFKALDTNEVNVESQSDIVTMKLLLKKIKIHRQVISEDDVPLDIRQKGA